VNRSSAAEAVAIYRLDKGRSAAVQVPRVSRDRSGLLPMEWVAGDVHPVDIAFRRDGGEIAYPRMVAFRCLATNRVFARCFFLPKGEAISREHVLAVYAEMIATWGQSRNLYCDNGSEFRRSEHADSLCRYAHFWAPPVLARGPGMVRALPYRPQSKLIDAAFAPMTKTAFPLIRGYTGSDRVKPKTRNAGKAVTPFPGTPAELGAEIARALAVWHEKPRAGHLGGKSPNQRYRELCDAGWQPAVVERGELEVHFSDLLDRTVTPQAAAVGAADGRFFASIARRPPIALRASPASTDRTSLTPNRPWSHLPRLRSSPASPV
jgi:hypothetical protein